MAGHADSAKVVIAALIGNALIAVSKFVAAAITGNVATLAEAVHSVADTGNQVLLMLGMRLSAREPTEHHPFGRAAERYFWAFVVSIMLFTIGGGFALYEGVHKLLHLRTAVTESTGHGSNLWNYGVLGLATLFELYSFSVAWREFRKLRGTRTTSETLRATKDPTIPVVLLEDSAALIGLVVALIGVSLGDLTGWAGWDGVASIAIGLLLCAVAVFLSRETHSLLLGESATPEDRRRVRDVVMKVGGVRGVTQLLTLHRGPEDVLLALKVDFDPGMAVTELEEAINLIESRVREALPHMRYIFVEPDSGYRASLDQQRGRFSNVPNVKDAPT